MRVEYGDRSYRSSHLLVVVTTLGLCSYVSILQLQTL